MILRSEKQARRKARDDKYEYDALANAIALLRTELKREDLNLSILQGLHDTATTHQRELEHRQADLIQCTDEAERSGVINIYNKMIGKFEQVRESYRRAIALRGREEEESSERFKMEQEILTPPNSFQTPKETGTRSRIPSAHKNTPDTKNVEELDRPSRTSLPSSYLQVSDNSETLVMVEAMFQKMSAMELKTAEITQQIY
jgi:hypothetical protein